MTDGRGGSNGVNRGPTHAASWTVSRRFAALGVLARRRVGGRGSGRYGAREISLYAELGKDHGRPPQDNRRNNVEQNLHGLSPAPIAPLSVRKRATSTVPWMKFWS